MGLTLEELAENAKKNLPEQIVTHALQLVYAGTVMYKGGNMWDCEGYEINHYAKDCTCTGRYIRHEKWGKLCPHHIAVMLERRYQQENPKQRMTLDDILRRDGIKEIRIEWNYEDNRRTVIGYVDRNGVTRLKSDEKFDTDYQRFTSALRRHDYCLDALPHKLEGTFEYIYQYKLIKTSGIVLTENVWNTRSVTNAMVEAKVRRDVARRFEKEFSA